MVKEIFKFLKYWVHTWGMWLPIQLSGIFCLYLLFTSPPDVWLAYSVIGYICLMMIGVSACYHRLISHKSFTTGKWRRRFMLWCAIMSGQGSPIYWAVIHRGYHHKKADTDKDIHSPKHGFWHSYLTWMFKIKTDVLNTKYVLDLIADEEIVFLHKNYILIFWVNHLIFFLIDPTIWLWFLMFPAFLCFHSFALNNSINHWTKLGYRNFKTNDDSINVPWLWPLILGETWHNNHHAMPNQSNFGHAKWWELDPTWWIIKIMRSDR